MVSSPQVLAVLPGPVVMAISPFLAAAAAVREVAALSRLTRTAISGHPGTTARGVMASSSSRDGGSGGSQWGAGRWLWRRRHARKCRQRIHQYRCNRLCEYYRRCGIGAFCYNLLGGYRWIFGEQPATCSRRRLVARMMVEMAARWISVHGGEIVTAGTSAHGIQAQSIGGGGGNGGIAGALFALGGTGCRRRKPLTPSTLMSKARERYPQEETVPTAFFAQSIGGSGGYGTDSYGLLGIGGNGQQSR